MPRTEARVKTAIWRDTDWLALQPIEKLTYLTVLSQPTLSLCGVVAYTPSGWANSMGATAKAVRAAVTELVARKFLVLDSVTEELWVRSFIKNDGVLKKPYMVIAMAKDVCSVHSPAIRGHIFDSLGAGFVDGLPEQFTQAFGGENAKQLPEQFVDMFMDWFVQ